MQYHWKNHMWNIISCLILPKSLTYLFIAVIYKYHWSDSSYRKWNRKFTGPLLLLLLLLWTTTLMRACVTHLTKHLSRDYATYWIGWLEDESAVWNIQIDTKKYFDTWFYRCFVMMLDADTRYSIGDTIMRRYQK